MLMPKRVKFRRVQRGRLKGKASRGTTISNGNYLIVSGIHAVGENSAKQSISGVTTFDQRKPLSNFVYSYDGSSVSKGTVSHSVTNNINANFYDSATPNVLFTVNGMSLNGSSTFQLYPVTVQNNVYQLYTFTYQNTAEYQRQFVTCDPAIN